MWPGPPMNGVKLHCNYFINATNALLALRFFSPLMKIRGLKFILYVTSLEELPTESSILFLNHHISFFMAALEITAHVAAGVT